MRLSPIVIEYLESRCLLSTGTVTGVVFNDLNGNGAMNAGEPGLAHVKVFVDLKKTGVYAVGDPFVTSGAGGAFTFVLNAGTYSLNAQPLPGFQQSFPFGGHDALVVAVAGLTSSKHYFGQTTTAHVGGVVQLNVTGKLTPLAGIQVSIAPATGGTAFFKTTDSFGAYGIGGLPFNKAYKVTLSLPPGFVSPGVSLMQTTPILASGKSDNNLNFTVKPIEVLGTSKRFVQLTYGFAAAPNALPPITQTAVGYNAFSGNVSASKTQTFNTASGPDTITVGGSSKQTSAISLSEFTDSGTTFGSESATKGGGTAFAQGESYFSATFTINIALNYSIAASFSPSGPAGGSATLSFTGPGNAAVFPAKIGNGSNNINVNQSGTLAAGTYTLTFDVKAFDNNGKTPTSTYALDFHV